MIATTDHARGLLLLEAQTDRATLRPGESDPGGWWGGPQAGSLLWRGPMGDLGIDAERETRRALRPLTEAGVIDVDSVSVTVSRDEVRVTLDGAEVL